jgi:light-regulated signal transduction histidine kinase (bacteriophytochrome)
MGVSATHVVSVIVDNALWGMLICHHYNGSKYLDFNSRILLELIANQFSNKLGVLALENLRLQEEHQNEVLYSINMYSESQNFDNLLKEYWSDISKLIDACGYSLCNDNNTFQHYGATPSDEELAQLHSALNKEDHKDAEKSILYSNSIKTSLEDWQNEEIAGYVCLEISSHLNDYIYFWRTTKEETINWAGNPEKSMNVEEKNKRLVLTPRASFDIWVQKEKHKSSPLLHHQKIFVEKLYRLLSKKELSFAKTIFEENT